MRLARLGVQVGIHQAPRARAAAVRERFGTAGEPLAMTLDALDAQRYGGEPASGPGRHWWGRFESASRDLGRVQRRP
jgi:hypothetical protein